MRVLGYTYHLYLEPNARFTSGGTSSLRLEELAGLPINHPLVFSGVDEPYFQGSASDFPEILPAPQDDKFGRKARYERVAVYGFPKATGEDPYKLCGNHKGWM